MFPVVPAQSASGMAAGLDVSAIAAFVFAVVRLDQPCRPMALEARGLSQAALSEESFQRLRITVKCPGGLLDPQSTAAAVVGTNHTSHLGEG